MSELNTEKKRLVDHFYSDGQFNALYEFAKELADDSCRLDAIREGRVAIMQYAPELTLDIGGARRLRVISDAEFNAALDKQVTED